MALRLGFLVPEMDGIAEICVVYYVACSREKGDQRSDITTQT